MDGIQGNPDRKQSIRAACITVVCALRRVAPCLPLQLSVKFIKIRDLSDPLNIEARIFGELLNMSVNVRLESQEDVSMINAQFEKIFHICAHGFRIYFHGEP